MSRRTLLAPALAAACACLPPARLAAQAPAPRDSAAHAATAAAPPAPQLTGQLFGGYGYRPAITDGANSRDATNAFSLDRASVTWRSVVAERTSVRLTLDVYQPADTSTGYAMRAKFASLQYEGPASSSGARLAGRVGLVENIVIELGESYFPRFLAQSIPERAGYFSSADAGVAALLTLPGSHGEAYAEVVNGPGYQGRERDRFKDVAARLTLTPLASRLPAAALLHTLALTAWGYKGMTGSQFAAGGAGQVGAVREGLDRSRAGVIAGLRDPRLTASLDLSVRRDGYEDGSNTPAAPRATGHLLGTMAAGSVVARPAAAGIALPEPLRLVARYDMMHPTARREDAAQRLADRHVHVLILGGIWDLNPRAQVALDYQDVPADASVLATTGQAHGFFAQFNVTF